MKCDLCNEKIGETFLEKIKGTTVKINKDGENKIFYACNKCQKKHKDIKAELSKK